MFQYICIVLTLYFAEVTKLIKLQLNNKKKTGAQNKEIKQYQEKWLQHHSEILRMDTNRLPKQALQCKQKGRRNIGRPRKRWRDQLHLEDQGTGNMPNSSGT